MSTTSSAPMGDRGRLVVPAIVRKEQGWEQGDNLVFVSTQDGVALVTREQLLRRVRGELRGRPSLVQELLSDRAREVADNR